jgi:5-methylcytosine-specific restriction endonuclease McrA
MKQAYLLPHTFICKGCGDIVFRKAAGDRRKEFCSPKCKVRGFYQRKAKTALCRRCGVAVKRPKATLCRPCRLAVSVERLALKPVRVKATISNTCVVCGVVFQAIRPVQTCSKACRAERFRLLMTGKTQRRTTQQCRTCHQVMVIADRANPRLDCPTCYKRRYKREHGYLKSSYKRAKHLGVERDRSLSMVKVGTRDRWICQLCGCRTLRQQRSTHDRYPNVDHIVPLARGGTHTWSNVQLTCRKCNQLKSVEIRGQFRLAI